MQVAPVSFGVRPLYFACSVTETIESVLYLLDFQSYLSFTVVWADEDIQLVEIQACNGRFGGATEGYFAYGGLLALSNQLKGFPKITSQKEVFTLDSSPGNTAELSFQCIDRTGRTAVRAKLVQNNESVEMWMTFEPAALDRFCRELASVDAGIYRQAVLLGAV